MPLKFSKPVEEFDFANIRKKVYMTKMMIAACALLLRSLVALLDAG